MTVTNVGPVISMAFLVVNCVVVAEARALPAMSLIPVATSMSCTRLPTSGLRGVRMSRRLASVSSRSTSTRLPALRNVTWLAVAVWIDSLKRTTMLALRGTAVSPASGLTPSTLGASTSSRIPVVKFVLPDRRLPR